MTGLDATIRARRGTLDLRLDLAVAAGEVVAMMGPNGSGKSTVAHLVSGVLRLGSGGIRVAEREVDRPESGIFVPAGGRGVALVFQDYRLFDHLSALDNVAFGLRATGLSKAVAAVRAAAWLERVGLAEVAATCARSLSGGQRQRVALARALVTDPRVVVLDEPLAALDATTRPAIRTVLRHHLRTFGGASLVITHDLNDAVELADRMVVLEQGRVVQDGTGAELIAAPATPYVRGLVARYRAQSATSQ